MAGNLFDHSLTITGYRSLLQTLAITGKKKHFKKIAQHIVKHATNEEI